MIVQSFCSGSSGNAALVQAGDTAILIDCGLGPRMLRRAMSAHGVEPEELDAVFVTHEHIDHVRGLDAILKRQTPVHATAGTARHAGVPEVRGERLSAGDDVRVGSLTVTPISTSHDAAEPCGYSFTDGVKRVTLLTDLGETHDGCLALVAASDLVIIEANHDVQMLKGGPYPAHLKRRVLSNVGHLSNADCGRYLARALAHAPRSRTIWLAHLSATNNRPALAEREVRDAVAGLGRLHRVSALPRQQPGPVWNSDAAGVTEQLTLFTS